MSVLKNPAPVSPRRQTFVQTERKAHLALGKLAIKQPSAAAVLNTLIGLMDKQCTVCISHQTLKKLLGIHLTTVKKAMKTLREDNWVQQIQLGPTGTVNAYIVNSRVAWADRRENLRLARFSAVIIADADEQTEATLSDTVLQKVPMVHPPEEALPTGEYPDGETGYLEGMEPVIEAQPDQTNLED